MRPNLRQPNTPPDSAAWRGAPSRRSERPPLMRQLNWQARAVCRDEDPELFFPDPSDTVTARAAQRVCATCPVRPQCRAAASARREPYGIWGGVNRELDADRRRAASSPPTNEISTPPTTPSIAEAAQ
ncbi:WhiB family transcriptional regulator [Mycobacteroides abscessus]|uniref:WhiB family transcriptional regulator n=1 Tax=Mycobacteroides abscessus TaxID=36809 RepID=UPI002E800647|nr:WhiB family transcriptional regulator [Mycobacteroides abscessus]